MPAMPTEAALYRLMSWLSPAYPIGAFSYSHGLEYAVEDGLARDRATLVAWIETVLRDGAGRIDAAFLAAGWRAVQEGGELDELIEEALAWRGTTETVLESTAQGNAFLTTTRRAWPHPMLDAVPEPVPLSVAVGASCGAHGLPLASSLTAYLAAFAANLVSAGVRLIPLGQTDGQAAVAALEAVVIEAVSRALDDDLDEIGSAAPLIDWCSMKHETQYTRLFRS